MLDRVAGRFRVTRLITPNGSFLAMSCASPRRVDELVGKQIVITLTEFIEDTVRCPSAYRELAPFAAREWLYWDAKNKIGERVSPGEMPGVGDDDLIYPLVITGDHQIWWIPSAQSVYYRAEGNLRALVRQADR